MDKRTDKSIRDFITLVANQNPNLITAYLFGSYAKGKQKADSDIDLALIIDHLNDSEKFDLQVQLMLQASEFDLRIEPHPLSSEDFYSNNPFVAEIRRTGIEIKPRTPNVV
jgi:predicted nucleotidyltransferase